MFSHITLFNLLTKDGAVQNTSVIVSTKDNFFLEMKKGPDSVHLGGGMFGALMFATCYLFDEVGAYIIGIILVILGILCITNKHIGEVLAPVGRILRSQFQVMQGDYKDWRAKRTAEQTEKKKQQEAQGANALQNMKKLLSRWKKSQLILRLFRISLRIIL